MPPGHRDSCAVSSLLHPHPQPCFPQTWSWPHMPSPVAIPLAPCLGWGMAHPQSKSCRRRAQPQPPAAGQGSSRAGQGGAGSRGHWPPLLPHLPAKASPAGVKLIRRASGERVRPPSPRMSSPPPAPPQPWPGLTDLCFLSPHQPSPPHMALASTAK